MGQGYTASETHPQAMRRRNIYKYAYRAMNHPIEHLWHTLELTSFGSSSLHAHTTESDFCFMGWFISKLGYEPRNDLSRLARSSWSTQACASFTCISAHRSK